MTARTHDVIAFASLVTVSVITPPDHLSLLTLFASLIGNIIGALLPDMDQASNKLWDLLPVGNALGKVLRRLFYKHRTISHSLLGLVIVYKILEFILPRLLNAQYVDPYIVLVSVMIGYVSHLVADSFTKEGLPLLFPLQVNFGFPPFEFLRITTGKWVEKYLVFPGVGIYLVWLSISYQSQLKTLLLLISK